MNFSLLSPAPEEPLTAEELRSLVATAALAGLLANPDANFGTIGRETRVQALARTAVAYADALQAALAKPPEGRR